jgi:hypothetical protein
LFPAPDEAVNITSKTFVKAACAVREKILVGLLVDSRQVPHWAYAMIEKIVKSDYAQITMVVCKAAADFSGHEKPQNKGDKFTALFFSLAHKLDRLVSRPETSAFVPKDLQQLLPNIDWITVTPNRKGLVESMNAADCSKIREYTLDVLIKLGFGDLKGEVLSTAKYGVWAYCHGDHRTQQVGGPGFWEVMEGRGETGSMVLILADDHHNAKVLYRSFAQTDYLSVSQNNNNNHWKTVPFIPRILQALHEGGEESFLASVKANNQQPFFYSGPIDAVPPKKQLVKLLLRHLAKIIAKSIQDRIYFEQYILLYGINKAKTFSLSLSRYKKLLPPKDRFWADPFIIYENHQYYIFMEEVLAANNKGHISYLIVDENENVSISQKVIEKPYHMSYPFIFLHNNEYYMIPETSANKTIELYKCVGFPDKWELVMNLMENIQAFDTTILQKDGKWWLFANIRDSEKTSSFDELFLFYSDDLFSQNWIPHAKNPIVSDVRSARPAGKIFTYNGNLCRPSQNSSKLYGYGIKINHIVTLTEVEYKEVCVNDIEPLWDPQIKAVHTLNFVHEMTIIDGLMDRARYPDAIIRRFRRLWDRFVSH